MRLHHLPPATPNITVHTGPGSRCEWRECWGLNGLRLTKEAEEPPEHQKAGHKDPSTKVEQQRSIAIIRFLQNLVALNEPWADPVLLSTFLNGFGQDNSSTQGRRVNCESGSQCNFAPQGGEIWPKMECMAGKKCALSLCQTDDVVFSPEI